MTRVMIRYRGFTLIETILASVILCASVLVFGAITTRSLSSTRLNRQYETAAGLASKQLVLIDYTGIEDFLNMATMEGYFEQFEPVYHWQVTADEIDIDYLYEVKITVSWLERNHRYDVLVSTRMNGTGQLIEETEQ